MLSPNNIDRRRFLAMTGVGWLTPVGNILARQAESSQTTPKSIILLWLQGGPSQLETFDPHPGTMIAGGTQAIETRANGLSLAQGFDRLADQMDKVTLLRSVVSPEGDHERGTYLMKTGYRPDPTVVHPSIGAICCHETPIGRTEIPRHVSILAGQWPSRGGFLGGEYDAFQLGDPLAKLPDMRSPTRGAREQSRIEDLDIVERAFAKGRSRSIEATMHRETFQNARKMMTSEQLKAFDLSDESESTKTLYGNTSFGRGCLAARRLIEVGVRCVEVTLEGWDSHVKNHEFHQNLIRKLDPAFAALLHDLEQRDLLKSTVVLCGGEFGRTPKINPLGGRDHWNSGYSLALAGAGLGQGRAIGATDPEGKADPSNPIKIENVHATILKAVGLDPTKENIAPITGRPLKLSAGKVIQELVG